MTAVCVGVIRNHFRNLDTAPSRAFCKQPASILVAEGVLELPQFPWATPLRAKSRSLLASFFLFPKNQNSGEHVTGVKGHREGYLCSLRVQDDSP